MSKHVLASQKNNLANSGSPDISKITEKDESRKGNQYASQIEKHWTFLPRSRQRSVNKKKIQRNFSSC